MEIQAWHPGGNTYIPLYWVRWRQAPLCATPIDPSASTGSDIVAMVELLQPENRLLQLQIEKPQYLGRKRLVVPHRDDLLMQTDDPRLLEIWSTTHSYKTEAVGALLKEANDMCRKLNLPDQLPIRAQDLIETFIETPFLCDHQKRFGTICTRKYVYAAITDNKLSYIQRNFRVQDERQFLLALKSKYGMREPPKGMEVRYLGERLRASNPLDYSKAIRSGEASPMTERHHNAIYQLAVKFLSAASVDVASLENDSWAIDIETLKLANSASIPLYQIHFYQGEDADELAYVEVLEPASELEALRIGKPEYLKRGSLSVPNGEHLVAPTDSRAVPTDDIGGSSP